MTTASKNLYIDKLDDIVSEYNNALHRAIKMKLIKLNIIRILTILKKLMIKILYLKLVIMEWYQNTKTFLLKDILQSFCD